MINWKRSQPTVLRPFFGAQSALDLLDDAEIILRSGGDPTGETRIVQAGSLSDVDPILLPRVAETAVQQILGEKRNAFELAVTLRTHHMFRRELVSRHSLANEIPESITIPKDCMIDAKQSGLFEIGLSICFTYDGDLGPGWPEHVGAWLSRKTFTVGLDRSEGAFRIRPLTEAVRKRASLPDGTFIYVEDVSDLNEIYEEGEACAVAYVSEGVMAKQAGAKPKSAINALLYSEVVAAILTSPGNGIDEATEITPDSPLSNLVTNLSTPKLNLDLPTLKELVKDPVKLRAHVHDASNLVREMEKL